MRVDVVDRTAFVLSNLSNQRVTNFFGKRLGHTNDKTLERFVVGFLHFWRVVLVVAAAAGFPLFYYIIISKYFKEISLI